MRRLVDFFAVITLIGLGAAIFYTHKDRYQRQLAVAQVADAVRVFDLKIKYHAATEGAQLTARGWPVTIDPAWFEGAVPRNPLVSGDRPWLEIAGPDDANLQHPRLRLAVDSGLASFWYNPYNGALRARVPVTTSDQEALEMYNAVNRVSLNTIFDHSGPATVLMQEVDGGVEDEGTDEAEADGADGAGELNRDQRPPSMGSSSASVPAEGR